VFQLDPAASLNVMATILIIDNDPKTVRLLERMLSSQGHRVVAVDTGAAGLDQAQQLQPALIICAWDLPGQLTGLKVCQRIKQNPRLSTFLLLLTRRNNSASRIQGLKAGADDLLTKPVDLAELTARLQAGLRLHQLTRDLQQQKQLLEAELAEAAAYVQSLLPSPLTGKVPIDARFIPSRQLGGDCFDYYWLDPDYLAIYLLDVSGHGLGSALLSTSVLNVLRSQSLPGVNFYRPESVLRGLNETFQMSDQHEKYFTIWYGVYNQASRQLLFASAGHPPAVLISQASATAPVAVQHLRTPGLPIGMLSEASFTWQRCQVPPSSRLYVFSDGVYEVGPDPANLLGLTGFVDLLIKQTLADDLNALIAKIQDYNQQAWFSDDASLLEIHLA
jgi:sigma-B regulation protein RsbU (phosphoserine phosphatase)